MCINSALSRETVVCPFLLTGRILPLIRVIKFKWINLKKLQILHFCCARFMTTRHTDKWAILACQVRCSNYIYCCFSWQGRIAWVKLVILQYNLLLSSEALVQYLIKYVTASNAWLQPSMFGRNSGRVAYLGRGSLCMSVLHHVRPEFRPGWISGGRGSLCMSVLHHVRPEFRPGWIPGEGVTLYVGITACSVGSRAGLDTRGGRGSLCMSVLHYVRSEFRPGGYLGGGGTLYVGITPCSAGIQAGLDTRGRGSLCMCMQDNLCCCMHSCCAFSDRILSWMHSRCANKPSLNRNRVTQHREWGRRLFWMGDHNGSQWRGSLLRHYKHEY
jgi:hypothetical protein